MSENFIFSGHDTVALAQKYGTPLYVMSEDILRANISRIRTPLNRQVRTMM